MALNNDCDTSSPLLSARRTHSPSRVMSRIAISERVILVDVLAIFFGISSWIEINGLWVETPILVEKLPEAWNLASFIVIITQLANIGPITYSIFKFKYSLTAVEKPAIHLTLAIGCISCILLAIFWDRTVNINGSDHSIALLTLTGALAIVDCTTSVLYLPFMAHFKAKYLMSYLIGQGLSGLVPSIVALIQGIGGSPECRNVTETIKNMTTNKLEPVYSEPRFSVSVFFMFLFAMVLISWTSFILLNKLKIAQMETVLISTNHSKRDNKKSDDVQLDGNNSVIKSQVNLNSETNLIKGNTQMSKRNYIILLIIQSYVCSLTNGILPAIQTYSCLPYGDLAYHLSVTLSSISNPIACFLAFYINPNTYKRSLPMIITFGTICSAYIITTAVLSPSPPLVSTLFGKILIILVWICMTSSFSYTRACIASVMRNVSTGHKALFFCGVFTQIGSAIGAALMFVLVNYTHIFVAYYPCA